MKIYTNEYSLSERSDKTFWTPQFSDFKAAIKVDGVDLSNISLLNCSGVSLSSSGTINGYKAYDMTSGSEGVENFKVCVSGNPVFNLIHKTTDSTVYDVDATGEAFNLQPATADKLGGIKVGDGLAIAADGTLSAGGATYSAGTGIGIENNVISLTATIPTKTSDLTNDSGFLSAIPTDLSVSNLSSGTLAVNDRSYGECLLSGTYDDSTTFKFVVLSALPPPEPKRVIGCDWVRTVTSIDMQYSSDGVTWTNFMNGASIKDQTLMETYDDNANFYIKCVNAPSWIVTYAYGSSSGTLNTLETSTAGTIWTIPLTESVYLKDVVSDD